MQEQQTVNWKGAVDTIRTIRSILAWMVFPAFLLFVFAQQRMDMMNPAGSNTPWPFNIPRPAEFDTWVWTRNYCLYVAIIMGVLALPRLRAILGLLLTLTFFF